MDNDDNLGDLSGYEKLISTIENMQCIVVINDFWVLKMMPIWY